MLSEKPKEINFIILMILVLVMLVSIPPTFQKKITPKVGKPLPPVEFVTQNRFQVTPAGSFVLKIIPTNELSALVYRFEVFFDPRFLSAEEIKMGDFFKKLRILRKEINNENGNFISQPELLLALYFLEQTKR